MNGNKVLKLYYGIDLSDDEISEMGKSAYKRLVNKQVQKISLNEIQQSDKSKIQNILRLVKPDKNYKLPMQDYLKTTLFSTREKKHAFALRNRSYNIKANYKNRFDHDMKCRICFDSSSIEDEIHTFENCRELSDPLFSDIKLCHLLGEFKQQVRAIKYFSQIIMKRDLILEIKNLS